MHLASPSCLSLAVALLGCPALNAAPKQPMRSLPHSPGSEHNARSPLGTNLDAVVDYAAGWALTDAFKASRDWVSGSEGRWDDGRSFDVDANGWIRSLKPGQVARTLLFTDLAPNQVPAGEYVVTWTGKGELSISNQTVVSTSPGRQVVQFDPARGVIGITINATDPADPIRDIHVWMPGFGNVKDPPTFHPAFLDNLRMYRVLRFMDWMQTNNSKTKSWGGRPQRSHARWTHGVPAEVIAELANTLHADPWITVPHLADDDYVEQLATLLARTVDKERVLYVEYSNEVWNGVFSQSRDAMLVGKRLGLSSDDFEAQLRYYSKRSVDVFKIFERVFGGSSRLVRVMASQAANPWVSNTVLAHEGAWKHVDALAIAPYFGGELGTPENHATTRAMSLDDLFGWLRTRSLPMVRDWLRGQREVAVRYGVPLIAYEGGQHLAGVGPSVEDAAVNALFDAANRDPRMKAVYLEHLASWKEAGGTLFAHFVNVSGSSKWGRWGALESQLQSRTAAPKLDALQTFAEANPTWWPAR